MNKLTPVAWTNETAWIGVNHLGLVTGVNERFTADFGWAPEVIVGHPLTELMPVQFRDAHHLGFARFVQFGKPSILGQPLPLPLLTASGHSVLTETCIQAELRDGNWSFGAQMELAPGAGREG